MWSPATWTWRAALTCVLLESVLHGVRGRWEENMVFLQPKLCRNDTQAHERGGYEKTERVRAGTEVLCQQKSVDHRVGSAPGSGSRLAVVASALLSFIHRPNLTAIFR